MVNASPSKADLRDRARRNRVGLRIDHRRIRAGLAHHLGGVRARRPDGVTVLFAPLTGEPQLLELAERPELGRFALTRTPPTGGPSPDMTLTVHGFPCATERHRYGFAQPVASADSVDDDEVDVICVPGLLFDRHGGRLGYGAGYYDRFLARFGSDTQRIAISDGQLVECLPTDAHDEPMTHLATEAGVVPLPLD
ncbi:MAG: 5-formyltetrahydrofolate cyclo-ligase [Acidimicrobiales bacterium]